MTGESSKPLGEQHPPGISSDSVRQRITTGFATREMFEAYRGWLESGVAHEAFGNWADGRGVEHEQERVNRRSMRRCPCSVIREPHAYGDHEEKQGDHMPTGSLCEFERGNATVCADTADWRVSVGTRAADAQLTCGTHLAETCMAMYEAEGRRGVVLQVMLP